MADLADLCSAFYEFRETGPGRVTGRPRSNLTEAELKLDGWTRAADKLLREVDTGNATVDSSTKLMRIADTIADDGSDVNPRLPATHFRAKYGIPAGKLEGARRTGRIHGSKKHGRWHYSEADVQRLWPEDFAG